MKNFELAKILYEIADLLEIQNIAWKPVAFRKAARSIESLGEGIESIYKKGGVKGLQEIPGVGESIAKKIEEFLLTGKIVDFEKIKSKIPKGVEELLHIPGMGPKKVYHLHKELGIKSISDLENAAKSGKVRKLEGFGEKSERDILKGIELVKRGQERQLLGRVLPVARELEKQLCSLSFVRKAVVGGSLRRMKETIGDVDILVISSEPKKVMDFFTSLPVVGEVVARGPTKTTIRTKDGLQADVRVLEDKSFGAALQYFTGNKDHNVALRQIAIKKGMKLSEYGLFNAKTGKYLAGRTEEEVYNKLGLAYIEPELRENTGEIDAALKNKLPKLVGYTDIKGDLQMHTRWSDGTNSTEEMARACQNLGYEYIAITDHSKSERIARGLSEKDVEKHIAEIDQLQKKFKIRILKSAEVDILADGSLDYPNSLLKKLDIVVASVHSRFKSSKDEMTKRILKALDNEHVKILAHPTGRLINQREPYDLDLDRVFEKAAEKNVWLEINASPERLDLKEFHIKRAKEFGCKFVISTDSHSTDQLHFMELGIAQARRGWTTKDDVANTLPWNKFEKLIKK